MTDQPNLHNTTDAAIWAKEFCKKWPTALCQVEGREGVETEEDFEAIMLGWFANAIMAGVDSEAQKARADLAPKVKPLAFAITDKDTGKVRIVDASKYNPLDPDFWISEEARNSCEVVPLYPSPATAPITPAQAAIALQEAMSNGLDPFDVSENLEMESLAIRYAGNRGDAVVTLEIAEKFMKAALKAIAEEGE